MIKRRLILSVIFYFAFVGLVFALNGSQGGAAETVSGPVDQSSEAQWVWGEIVAIDAAKNELTVKYLDYETDQEKELVLLVDEKTSFENARALSEIKPQSPAGIDYIIDNEGKNIARNISIENMEGLNSEGQPLQEAMTQEAAVKQ
jgi:hypothetical protein